MKESHMVLALYLMKTVMPRSPVTLALHPTRVIAASEVEERRLLTVPPLNVKVILMKTLKKRSCVTLALHPTRVIAASEVEERRLLTVLP